MGDAAGIGPEIIVKALAREDVSSAVHAIVVGDAKRLLMAAAITDAPVDIRVVDAPDRAHDEPGLINCIDLGLIPEGLPFGRLSAVAGDAAYQYIARAVALASAGEVDAICTAPINKEALQAGGHRFPGHTELLAHLTGTPEVSMMLTAPGLRVIHCTTHVGLIDAIARITPDLVTRTIQRGHEALVRAGLATPRIAVCGINPHAGEHGLFGRG
jgi:4-hydroxy-L-threonine phosphate dehydrogenase PdxA